MYQSQKKSLNYVGQLIALKSAYLLTVHGSPYDRLHVNTDVHAYITECSPDP